MAAGAGVQRKRSKGGLIDLPLGSKDGVLPRRGSKDGTFNLENLPNVSLEMPYRTALKTAFDLYTSESRYLDKDGFCQVARSAGTRLLNKEIQSYCDNSARAGDEKDLFSWTDVQYLAQTQAKQPWLQRTWKAEQSSDARLAKDVAENVYEQMYESAAILADSAGCEVMQMDMQQMRHELASIGLSKDVAEALPEEDFDEVMRIVGLQKKSAFDVKPFMQKYQELSGSVGVESAESAGSKHGKAQTRRAAGGRDSSSDGGEQPELRIGAYRTVDPLSQFHRDVAKAAPAKRVTLEDEDLAHRFVAGARDVTLEGEDLPPPPPPFREEASPIPGVRDSFLEKSGAPPRSSQAARAADRESRRAERRRGSLAGEEP